ncbi:MAG: MBOAT family protein [Deltaproteobacteria bacterium]|nr:MAG: MBOAT family protein [Deltaproteobacteria bacterium]
MLFNSLIFVIFFSLIVLLYYTVKDWKKQKSILLIGSYLFYAAWNPPFVLLLWFSTVVDWIAAKKIEQSAEKSQKKFWLCVSLVVNLGFLAFFKYGNFALESFTGLLNLAGMSVQWAPLDIILPVGISFYTFQTLSYTIDVYRGDLKPSKSFLDFALYVTFFPQLVAGPIVRAVDFIPQCESPKKANTNQFGWGLYFMTLGLFQKVVLADVFLAPAADAVFGWSKGPLAPLDTWIGTLAFTGQIFFDFAGYSTCAIGAALCLGFVIPDNFRFPYAAMGFSNFWQRWHISLSSWLRDYLYISLGGNRVGAARTAINLMFTMLLGGLWHGASWTFVAWGALHGVYLIIEHSLKSIFPNINMTETRPKRIFVRLITFFFVVISWVFFRSNTFEKVMLSFLAMFGIIKDGAMILPTVEIYKVVIVIFALVMSHWFMRENKIEYFVEKLPKPLVVAFWSFMVFALIITQGGNNAFIYFQF